MWRKIMMGIAVGLLVLTVQADGYQRKTSGAKNPGPIAVVPTPQALVTGYTASCTIEVDETAAGCIYVLEHEDCAHAFDNGNGGKRLCRGIQGQPDPAGWEFTVGYDGAWGGPLCSKTGAGYTSVLTTRSCT